MAKKKAEANPARKSPGAPPPKKFPCLSFEQAIDAMAPWYTQAHIARELGIDEGTLLSRVKEIYGCGYSELRDIKRNQSFSRLARVQLEVACEDKNPTMLVWLGKQYLNQS